MSAAEMHELLTEHLTEYADEDGHEGFTVRDLLSADWALRKIAQHRRKLDQAEQLAAAERDRIADWLASENARCQLACAWLESQLEAFARAQIDLDDRHAPRTVNLPAGELRLRANPERFDFSGEFVEWARSTGRFELLRVKVEADKVAARKMLRQAGGVVVDADGEVVPGVTVVPAEVRFSAVTS